MINNNFRAYNDVSNRIRVKEMELMKLREDYYNITGINYTDVKISGGIKFDMSDKLHFIVEKEKEIKSLENQKKELRMIHENEINKIHNTNKRTVLKLFYLDHCSIKQIAYCLRISDGHVKKLKRWAVQEFIEKNLKEG